MADDHLTGMELWTSTAWRESMTTWVDARLAETSAQRTGEPEQVHLRPWGTVFRIPTATGPVWFKAPAPATVFEVGLYGLFAREVIDGVLTPLAIDTDRGWLLLPDGGTTLGNLATGGALVDALATIMPRYAQLQRDLAPEVDAMLALGVTDMRPAAMPARFDEAFAAVESWVTDHGDAADQDLLRRLDGHRTVFRTWCERLANAPGAPSLDHNDLHPHNVFVPGGGNALRATFVDWGDAVIAHSFASLLVALRFARYHLDVASADPAILRVRDAYLDVFADLAPRADLVATADLACQVAKVTRALAWVRALQDSGQADADPDDERAPLVWLAGILNDDPLETET